jgi:cell division septal protein FtsQ
MAKRRSRFTHVLRDEERRAGQWMKKRRERRAKRLAWLALCLIAGIAIAFAASLGKH